MHYSTLLCNRGGEQPHVLRILLSHYNTSLLLPKFCPLFDRSFSKCCGFSIIHHTVKESLSYRTKNEYHEYTRSKPHNNTIHTRLLHRGMLHSHPTPIHHPPRRIRIRRRSRCKSCKKSTASGIGRSHRNGNYD